MKMRPVSRCSQAWKDGRANRRRMRCSKLASSTNPHCVKRGQLFRRTWKFFSAYRGSLAVLLASLVLLTVTGIITPYLSGGFLFDEVIDTNGSFAGAILLVLFLVIATKLLRTFASVLNNWLSSKVAAKMTFSLKQTIFHAIERLSLGFFTDRRTGSLMTQINEDSNTIYEFFCDGIPYLVVNLVQVAVLVILLLTIQPLLALFALLPVPLFFLLMRVMFRVEAFTWCLPRSARVWIS